MPHECLRLEEIATVRFVSAHDTGCVSTRTFRSRGALEALIEERGRSRVSGDDFYDILIRSYE